MKKITLLITFTAIFFSTQAQVLNNTAFDSNINGWGHFKGGEVSHTIGDGANAPGSMQIIAIDAFNSGAHTEIKIKPVEAGGYLLTFKVKGNAGDRIASVVQQVKTYNPGAKYKIKTTGVWEEYSHFYTDITKEPMQIRIISRTPNTTFLIDDVSFVLQ